MATLNSDAADEIRMVVKVRRNCHPELFEELSAIEVNGRAERMRTLASMEVRGSGKRAERPTEQQPQESAGAPGNESAAQEVSTEPEQSETDQGPDQNERREMISGLKSQF